MRTRFAAYAPARQVENATEYRVYRNDTLGDLRSYAVVPAIQTMFTDENTELTYTYAVTAVVGGQESEITSECIVEATAIPFFNGLAGPGLAAVATAGVLFAGRRRLG